jgi:flagellar basal-body rod protein FlgB
MGAIDTGLDFYRTVLELRGFRQELISADIANASTPQFKAVDLDFRAALAELLSDGQAAAPAAAGGFGLLVSDEGQIESDGDGDGRSAATRRASSAVRYQVGGTVTLDGNSVDIDYEKRTAAENALDYEAAANFTSQTVNMLMVAIKGSAANSSSGA